MIDLAAGDTVVPVAVAVSPVAGGDGARGFACPVQGIRVRLAVEHALTEAHDQAEAGMGAKADFLATMSHELRTPLNAVIGYAELLIDDAGPHLEAGDLRDLGRIRTGGRVLLDLVNQVLDLARLDAGRGELRPESVDPPRSSGRWPRWCGRCSPATPRSPWPSMRICQLSGPTAENRGRCS